MEITNETIEVAFSEATLQQLDHRAIVEQLRGAGIHISADGKRVKGVLQWNAARNHPDGLVAKWQPGSTDTPMTTPKS
jgi:hypothetical protein